MIRLLSDPLWRAVFLRTALALLLVSVAGRAGWTWALGAGLVGALSVATSIARRTRPLRRRVLELADASNEVVRSARARRPQPSAARLAAMVGDARERLAEARRKAEHERDDVLAILQATSEGILVLGHHNRVEIVNDAARRLLEPPVDALGRPLHEVVRERAVLEFAEQLKHGENPAPRSVQVSGAGGPRLLYLTGALVRGERIRRRAVLVLHDLTEIQRLERVRTDFVANVTHEMRSPLASILGYAETLAVDGLDVDEARDFVERILRNAHRLDDIIRDLIELSRLENATAAEVEPTGVARLLEEILEGFRDQAAAKEVALGLEATGLPPTLEIDPGLLRQALSNLVDNAVKYTPPGGRVVLRGSFGPAAEGGDAGPVLTVEVEDTGPGIPVEHRARIFERFYRVDTARSRALGGTGLGLSIVKHAVALHGGSVDLAGGPEEGSVFRVHIPVALPSIGP